MAQFYFAWVGSGETTFGVTHERFDEDVFSLSIEQGEGAFATAIVDVRNPRIGLLNPGRNVWAHLAYDDDLGNSDSVTHLFFGRLIGVPENLQNEIIRLNFIARPLDFDTRKRAAADALKIAPYWDEIWIDESRRDDPDTALEAYPSLWHIDRLDHTVTASDINTGEDGTVALGTDHYYDALSISYAETPLRKVEITGEVFWQQDGAGEVDLTGKLLQAFEDAGSTTGGGRVITTLTGEGLQRDYPTVGTSIGGGWEWSEASLTRVDETFGYVDYGTTLKTAEGTVTFPIWKMKPVLKASFNVSRARSEKIMVTMEADTQALLTEPGDSEVSFLSLASSDIANPVDDVTTDNPDGLPIIDATRRSYFPSDRGRTSIEYLIALARARLLSRARAVRIELATSWENGLALSCRQSMSIDDDRIPGGTATGKITNYVLSADGDSGELTTRIQIMASIGRGNTVSAVAGDPDYVEAGYVEVGYQTYSNQVVSPIDGITYNADYTAVEPNDDGVNLFNVTPNDAVLSMTVVNGLSDQPGGGGVIYFPISLEDGIRELNETYTQVFYSLLPLDGGPFETVYPVTTSLLMVPKTIDLEADEVTA